MDNVEAANTLMAGSCVTVNTGGEIPKPTAAGACYKLSFPTDPATDFHATVNTMGVDKVALTLTLTLTYPNPHPSPTPKPC